MKQLLIILGLFLSFLSPASAQLTVGDIALIGFSTDDDAFAFVTLTDVAANQVIEFTDAGWTGTAFSTNFRTAGTMTWTNSASILPAGEVVIIDDGGVSFGEGSVSGTQFLSGNNNPEVLFAFTGLESNPNIIMGSLYGRTGSILTSGSISGEGETYVPSSLSLNTTFQNLSTTNSDNGSYSGSALFLNASLARIALADGNNWTTTNASSFELDGTGIVFENIAIPEASTYGLLLGVGMLILVFRNLRKSR